MNLDTRVASELRQKGCVLVIEAKNGVDFPTGANFSGASNSHSNALRQLGEHRIALDYLDIPNPLFGIAYVNSHNAFKDIKVDEPANVVFFVQSFEEGRTNRTYLGLCNSRFYTIGRLQVFGRKLSEIIGDAPGLTINSLLAEGIKDPERLAQRLAKKFAIPIDPQHIIDCSSKLKGMLIEHYVALLFKEAIPDAYVRTRMPTANTDIDILVGCEPGGLVRALSYFRNENLGVRTKVSRKDFPGRKQLLATGYVST